jgi:hypothetical protein
MQIGARALRKTERQRLIASLVDRKRLGTQLELIEALAEAGCHVTQATVSRDVRELGIVKLPDPLGRTRYSLPSRAGRVDPREMLESLLTQFGRSRTSLSSSVRSARRLRSHERSTASCTRSWWGHWQATTRAWSSRLTRAARGRSPQS